MRAPRAGDPRRGPLAGAPRRARCHGPPARSISQARLVGSHPCAPRRQPRGGGRGRGARLCRRPRGEGLRGGRAAGHAARGERGDQGQLPGVIRAQIREIRVQCRPEGDIGMCCGKQVHIAMGFEQIYDCYAFHFKFINQSGRWVFVTC